MSAIRHVNIVIKTTTIMLTAETSIKIHVFLSFIISQYFVLVNTFLPFPFTFVKTKLNITFI